MLHSVARQDTTIGYNQKHVYPYGSWINWQGTEWHIGYDPIVDVPVTGLPGAYSFSPTIATNYFVSVDTTYFSNSLEQGSLIYYNFESTNSLNLKLYITGLCKANTNTNLSMRYAYSTDGSTNFINIGNFSSNYTLTTEWTPFVFTANLSFGIVPMIRLVPLIWSGTYLYGPTIKDINIMLISDQHNG